MASVAVVGAGPAGLASAKAALEYGLVPTVFERAARPGGLWRPDGGFVWPTLTANVSRFTYTFSDYSWPVGSPDFPSAAAVADYLAGYARDFGVEPAVLPGCDVVGLEQVGSGWRVSWEHGGRRRQRWFDAVIVAAGVFAEPVVPPIPGAFGGPVLHSGRYRGAAQFADRRVVVAGMSFSGSEIAAELASAGVAVTVVATQPYWVLPRVVTPPGGCRPVPLDLLTRTRAARAGEPDAEVPEQHRRRNRLLAELGGNPGRLRGFPSEFSLDPDSTDPPHLVISDGLASAVQDGGISLVRGRVAQLDGSAVVLGDGRRIHADAIVWCTGFQPRLPFLPGCVRDTVGYDPSDLLQPLLPAYGVFPAGVERLYFVGMYRGPYLGTVELQARWACAVIAGAVPPPAAADVARGVEAARGIRLVRPRPQFPYDNVTLADRIGRAIGVLPASGEASVDVEDWFWNAPVVPAHYRMFGPHRAPTVAARQIAEAIARRDGRNLEEA